MKVLWILLIFVLSIVAAIPIDESERINGENGWYVPQLDGSFKWVDLKEAEALEAEAELDRGLSVTPVNYYLYTKSNPTKGQHLTATDTVISKSNFNAAHPTRFLIHGWTQSYKSGMNKKIRDAWLANGDFNIIIVDWMRARSVDYASSKLAVSTVGQKVASLIDFLATRHGLQFDTLQVIGHSLGAHVAGYAGKNVKSGQIHTIVGLDPAFPLFSYTNSNTRLCNTDAYYVESIQTNGGELGFIKPIGTGSFYPNGGKSQPGCLLDVSGACAHGRSVIYYAEAVEKNDFPSIKCPSYEAAVKDSCGGTYSSVRMGAIANPYVVTGDFYVPVHKNAPYGMAS